MAEIRTYSLTGELDDRDSNGDGAVISKKKTSSGSSYSLAGGGFRHFLRRLESIPAAAAGLLAIGFCCLVVFYYISLYSSSISPPAAGSFCPPTTTSPNPTLMMTPIRRRREIADDPELIKLLQTAKMTTTVGAGTTPASEVVIVTTINKAWAEPGSVLDLFLDGFRHGDGTQELLKHLVIVSLDEKAYRYCQAVHPLCYALTTPGVNFTGAAASFMTGEYLRLVWRSVEFYASVLSLGIDFVFTDADILWLRNPFPHFHEQVDFQAACDYFSGNDSDLRDTINTGFMFARSNARTRRFYQYWYDSRDRFQGKHDQDVLNSIKFDPFVAGDIRLRVKLLDTKRFGGICQPIKDLNVGCTMHVTCCVGLENKIRAMTAILDDWKQFWALPPAARSNSSTSFAWKPERTGCWFF